MINLRKVFIVGNNASNGQISDGGRIKIRLYKQLLEENNIDVSIIELDGWKKKLLKIIKQIKQAIKGGNTILVMAGPNGCRMILPLINHYNRNKNSRVVFCPLGIGTIDKLISGLNENDTTLFLSNENYQNIKDDKMARILRNIDLIIPQNDIIANCYRNYYHLQNVEVLNNFRNVNIVRKEYRKNDAFKLIYVSRVCFNKGIFDLIDATKKLLCDKYSVSLDIYGEIQMNDLETKAFFESLDNNIRYNGILKQEDCIPCIKDHDLFVLPTKYHGEGTPGALIEAFLSGTPTLVSSYSQANLLVEDNVDGFIYQIGDVEDLVSKIKFIYQNQDELCRIGISAQKKASKYTFSSNKDLFFKYIIGE